MNLKDGQRGKVTIWSRNFVCALIANFLLAFSHSSVNTLVSTYAVHLGASSVVMGLLTGMFFGVALAMRPVAGPITTKLDKRRLMIFVYTLGCVVNVGYAVFHNITAFVIFRFFNGVQYALVGSLCMTIAGDSLPMQKMASGLGVFGIGSAVATAIAPTVGIMMRDYGTSLLSLIHISDGMDNIVIQRTTGEYHGYMALILFAGYLAVIIYNLRQKDRKRRINIPWLLAIGVLVQFGWEAGLLVGGIRSAGFVTFAEKLGPLIINSLLETNLGMPIIYLIFIAYTSRFTEELHRREYSVSLTAVSYTHLWTR